MRIRSFLLFIILLGVMSAHAQRPVDRVYMVGYGHSSQLDTYLSPLAYTGQQLTFLTRLDRQTHWADGRIAFQSTFQGAALSVNDNSGRGEEWGAHLGYDAGWHYLWPVLPSLTLRGGALLGVDAGILYNLRNSNNPAQGRFTLDLSLSAGVQYDFHISRARFSAIYQADMPLVGMLFSPQYGQSYYEISTSGLNHNICASYPGNAFSLRQLLTLDYHLKHFSLRLGYLWDVRQSHVNGIRMHDISHSVMLGFVKRFTTTKCPTVIDKTK